MVLCLGISYFITRNFQVTIISTSLILVCWCIEIMASLKRYRQTNDSNAAARFRDLPPRFKRQKSIPSTESGTPESPIKSTHNHKPRKLFQGDCLISEQSVNDNLISEEVKESEISKDKRILKKGNESRPHLTVDQTCVKRFVQPIVLSPMDNNLFNFVRNDEQESSSVADLNPLSWQNQQQQLWPRYTIETWPYPGTWTHSPSKQQTKGSPLYQNTNDSGATESPKDYSENDRRIIEMFKELERVADQKEKEENQDGLDSKSLVSHHLRMLMCAIDKYTEGIEDEVDSVGCSDESFSTDSSGSPSPVKNITRMSDSPNANLENEQTVPSTVQNAHATNTYTAQTMHQGGVIIPRTTYVEERPLNFISKMKPSLSIDMQPWDLWSSPSFNVLDVYSHISKGHNSSETADSTFALFDQLGMDNDYYPQAEEYLTRIPLYQR